MSFHGISFDPEIHPGFEDAEDHFCQTKEVDLCGYHYKRRRLKGDEAEMKIS
jgi:hypothetical protein